MGTVALLSLSILTAAFKAIDTLLLTCLIFCGQPLLRLIRSLQLVRGAIWAQSEDVSPRDELAFADAIIYFCSSGLFLPYYIGVAEYLKANFDCSSLIVAGVSGGYAPAASIVLGLDSETHWRAIEGMRVAGRSRALGNYFFSEHEMIHSGYLPLLEEDEPRLLRSLSKRRLWLGCTQLWPRPLRSMWTSSFESVKALCHACTCSMRVFPILRLPGKLRGCWVVDGMLGCHPRQLANAERMLIVSAVPSREGLSPKRVLGGVTDLARLPSRRNFDRWMAQGWEDASEGRAHFERLGLKPLRRSVEAPTPETASVLESVARRFDTSSQKEA